MTMVFKVPGDYSSMVQPVLMQGNAVTTAGAPAVAQDGTNWVPLVEPNGWVLLTAIRPQVGDIADAIKRAWQRVLEAPIVPALQEALQDQTRQRPIDKRDAAIQFCVTQ